ncbi:unnamed protein product [Candidula unifasciata]|uniref:Uncharacterized protein n=1 Tax=Candidula unifasciata TaxID=100452 RepID=A0A8S3YSL7_9EUPU|nr:unnamed protein product [Candidula unifasciata]
MSRSNELHALYLNSLNMFTRTAGKKKEDEKKNDQPKLKPSKNVPHKDIPLELPAFPLTANMLFLSFILWFLNNFYYYNKQNYQIENYTVGDAVPYLLRMRNSKKEDFPIESKTLPPLVTGITSSQFYQFQGLVRHIEEDLRPIHPNLKLIVYDLGQSSRARQLLHQYCNCEVRDFHFERFPGHVSTVSNFAWRPIIIHQILDEYGSVLYVEPTTRLKSPNSLNYLRMRGLKSYFVWDPLTFTSLVAYTDPDMFEYFNESRCAFKDCSLISSEAVAVYRTEATWVELMRPWLVCALNEQCIAPTNARYSGCIEIRHPHTTGCHRYDMSALSIILNRAVQYTIDSEQMVSFRLTYTDLEEVTYFPEQPWAHTQLFLLLVTPLLFVLVHKMFCKKRRTCRL